MGAFIPCREKFSNTMKYALLGYFQTNSNMKNNYSKLDLITWEKNHNKL